MAASDVRSERYRGGVSFLCILYDEELRKASSGEIRGTQAAGVLSLK